MRKRTAIYARTSTKDKGQDPETQLVVLRDWANRQNVEVTEYVDQASGKDLNRPVWKQLTDDWRHGKIDTVAVVRLDRAFRSIINAHTCLAEWEGRGIRFVCVTQPMDTGTPMGKFMVSNLASFAELERELIRDRVKEGIERARKEGKTLGRPKTKLSPARAQQIVDEHDGDVMAAAKTLGVGSATIYRRIKKVG